jgi:hypothetical protein
MRLNFLLTCPPYNVSVGPDTGVGRLLCQISTSNSDITDVVPVSVLDYRVIELDRSLLPIRVKTIVNASLVDGDVITFASTTLSNNSVIPGGLQISISGINTDDELLRLDIIVQYTNRCGVLPFNVGSSLGWIVFVSVSYCFYEIDDPTHPDSKSLIYIVI